MKREALAAPLAFLWSWADRNSRHAQSEYFLHRSVHLLCWRRQRSLDRRANGGLKWRNRLFNHKTCATARTFGLAADNPLDNIKSLLAIRTSDADHLLPLIVSAEIKNHHFD